MTAHRNTQTLDPDRAARFRAALVQEAGNDLLTRSGSRPAPATVAHHRRRTLIGLTAAMALAAGLLVATSFIDGGPAGNAAAVAFERTGDGWTRISLTDAGADPDQVVADLVAKGFDARKERITPSRDGSISILREEGGGMGIGMITELGGPSGPTGSIGLSVSFPEGTAGYLSMGDPEGTSDHPGEISPEQLIRDRDGAFQAHGVRIDLSDPTTFEIRDGSPATVVVMVFE